MNVDLQTVVQVIAYIAVAIIFAAMVKADLHVVKNDIKNVKTDQARLTAAVEQLPEILKTMAVSNQRIERIEQDIRELRHGDGLVMPLFPNKPPPKD